MDINKNEVNVTIECTKKGEGASFSFRFYGLKERPDFWEMQEFVRIQLENYLNNLNKTENENSNT